MTKQEVFDKFKETLSLEEVTELINLLIEAQNKIKSMPPSLESLPLETAIVEFIERSKHRDKLRAVLKEISG